MKKLLLVAVATGLMSTSAFALSYAVNASINYVITKSTGEVYIGIHSGTADFQKTIPANAQKNMLASALTAMTANKNVTFIMDGANVISMKISK